MLQNSFALNTYVGIKILDLKDDPEHSCANQATNDPSGVLDNYGPMGRIRAISSIFDNGLPLYFNLSKSDGTVIFQGNDTKDCGLDGGGCEYTINDTIFLPNTVLLTDGEDYNLMMDIDAIKVYLPINSQSAFTRNSDNMYWTAGAYAYEAESGVVSYNDLCSYGTMQSNSNSYNYMYFGNKRYINLGSDSCFNDNTLFNCDNNGFIGVEHSGFEDSFNIDAIYKDLYQPDIGNINIGFTYTE